ncbi:hypothetical protein DLM86_20540 [Paenibacillus flagellatus]|uniref:Cadherin-like beta sandwich domain-containing protein n=1 Tax=Paenibacillus flagellatus TaxID=2211139 RepID=A0A2V5K3W7_9BACL|nr:hypothetical protein DLM86_20540 [Paenibacillus flagellatus]
MEGKELIKTVTGFLAVLLGLAAVSGFNAGTVHADTPPPGAILVEDHFDRDSGLWDLISESSEVVGHPAIVDGRMRLTDREQSQVGTAWLKQKLSPPYDVTFKFRMYDPSDYPADGIVFMFNKKQNLLPVSGGGMGFEPGNGYGVEFDSWWQNPWDPVYSHVSLFKDNAEHLSNELIEQARYDAFIENSRIEDKWYDARIEVRPDSVKVTIDGALVMDKTGISLDNTYAGVGFTASTGAFSSLQEIDDVVISKPLGRNAFLEDASFPNTLMTSPFSGGSTTYDVYVPGDLTAVPFSIRQSDANARLAISVSDATYSVTDVTYGGFAFAPSTTAGTIRFADYRPVHTMNVQVTSEDGTVSNQYRFALHRLDPAYSKVGYAMLDRLDASFLEVYVQEGIGLPGDAPFDFSRFVLKGTASKIERIFPEHGPNPHRFHLVLDRPIEGSTTPVSLSLLPGALNDTTNNPIAQLHIPVLNETDLLERFGGGGEDGLHIDDVLGNVVSGVPDANGLPGFDRSDVKLLLRLLVPPFLNPAVEG